MHVNTGAAKDRRGVTQHKPPLGPPQLLKLGHIGIFVNDFARQSLWFETVLGLLPSDILYAGTPDHGIGGFFRLNRGADWVDHHTLAVFGMDRSDCHHVSFEVQDLKRSSWRIAGCRSRVGSRSGALGRHPLGSHVFDVWRDPSGYRSRPTATPTFATPRSRCRSTRSRMPRWTCGATSVPTAISSERTMTDVTRGEIDARTGLAHGTYGFGTYRYQGRSLGRPRARRRRGDRPV